MKWLLKIILDIFGNKASIVFTIMFILPLIGTAIWKWNAWLDERDAKAKAEVVAQQTAEELERAKEAQRIYAEEYSKAMDNRKKDEKAIAELQAQNEVQQALIDETLKQLDNSGGKEWANTKPPSNRQRVLFISLEELEAEDFNDLPAECNGTAAGCAVDRLRSTIRKRSENITP